MSMTAATQASTLFHVLPLMALLLAGLALICWNRHDKTLTEIKIAQLDRELETIRSRVTLVSTGKLQAGRVVKSIGYIEGISDMEVSSAWEYRLAEKEAMLKLALNALESGANAVIGVHKINSHYSQAGSRWCIARVCYCGTAVIAHDH